MTVFVAGVAAGLALVVVVLLIRLRGATVAETRATNALEASEKARAQEQKNAEETISRLERDLKSRTDRLARCSDPDVLHDWFDDLFRGAPGRVLQEADPDQTDPGRPAWVEADPT